MAEKGPSKDKAENTHLVLGAKLAHTSQVAWVWHNDTRLTLDRLHHEGSDIWVLQGAL